jgi:uncharacterized membrane protein
MIELSVPDLFFIITGLAIIIVTVLLVIGLVYVILFLRTIKEVARTAKRATDIVSEDISDLRNTVKERGVSLGALAKFAKNVGKRRILRKK